MPFPENTTAGPRTLRHAAILSLLLCSALIGVLSCVDHRPPFTGWQEPEPGMLVDGGRLIDVGSQSKGQAEERSRGCIDCHKGVVEPHGQAVHLSCIDCHGGDGLSTDIETAHPRADHPEKWPKGGANPERPYTLTLHENWDWIRFVNPGDLRVARTTCAPCHPNHTLNVSKSVMTTVSHFWAVAS
ncbi:MAG: hypothetical protein KDB53_19995, partial [Planctomycetes bacterium]|nr:hypothetical protein [Planctomycetota bacterium]